MPSSPRTALVPPPSWTAAKPHISHPCVLWTPLCYRGSHILPHSCPSAPSAVSSRDLPGTYHGDHPWGRELLVFASLQVFLAGVGVYVFLCLHVCVRAQGAVDDGMDGSVDDGIDSLPPTPGCDGQYWHRCIRMTSLEQCP